MQKNGKKFAFSLWSYLTNVPERYVHNFESFAGYGAKGGVLRFDCDGGLGGAR